MDNNNPQTRKDDAMATTKTKTRARCECGRVRSQYARLCPKCEKERREAQLTANRAIVATGRCPDCGARLRNNLAIRGWVQCSQYGADGFRADSTKPACDFQTFVA